MPLFLRRPIALLLALLAMPAILTGCMETMTTEPPADEERILPSTDPIIVEAPITVESPVAVQMVAWQPVVWPPGSRPRPGPAPVDQALDAGLVRRFQTMERLRAADLVTARLAAERRATNLGGLLPLSHTPSVTVDPLAPAPTPGETMARFDALKQMVAAREMTAEEARAEQARIIDALLPPAPAETLPYPNEMTAEELAAHGRRIDDWMRLGVITPNEAAAERQRIEEMRRRLEAMQAAMQAPPPVASDAPPPATEAVVPVPPALPSPGEVPPPPTAPATPVGPVPPSGLAPYPDETAPADAPGKPINLLPATG
jgi:polyhydroxyalkanoate synthesis regulator phasin